MATIRATQNYSDENASNDAEKLYEAMKGIGTCEIQLIEIICRRTNSERQRIIKAYRKLYGKDLMHDVLSDTSGNFALLLKALLIPSDLFEAQEVQNSIKGIGTNEWALIDIICTKRNKELAILKNTYEEVFKKNMAKDILDDVSGKFEKVLQQLLETERSDRVSTNEEARSQADELYKAGVGRFGTDEATFIRILTHESYSQLKLIFNEYFKAYGHELDTAIDKEMSGDLKNALLAIMKFVRRPASYFAERLYKAMKGIGTDDATLIRIIVLRSEIDLDDIKIEFNQMFSKTLKSFIEGDCSGYYKKALIRLIGD